METVKHENVVSPARTDKLTILPYAKLLYIYHEIFQGQSIEKYIM